MSFPRLDRLLLSKHNELREVMQHAIIKDGKIIATNGRVLVYHDLGVFGATPEKAEGKVFSAELIKKLAKHKGNIIFKEEYIVLSRNRSWSIEELIYSGVIDKTRNIKLFGVEESIGRYPNTDPVTPSDEDYKECTCGIFGLEASNMKILSDCFLGTPCKTYLKFEVSDPTKAIRVTIDHKSYGKQRAIIMPCIIDE